MPIWWTSRSPREQTLLAVMAALAAVVLLWFAVLAPLLAAQASAERHLLQARADEAVVRAAAAEIERLSQAAPAPTRSGTLEAVLNSTAQTAGLTVVRVEPAPEGLQAVVTGPAQALTPWLLHLQQDQGAQVRHLTLLKGEANQLQADMTLADLVR